MPTVSLARVDRLGARLCLFCAHQRILSCGEDHPGGQFLLLAFAGRDATEPFETIGPSVARGSHALDENAAYTVLL